MKKYLLFCLVAVGLASCSKDNPTIENEEEVITTVQYKLTPVNGGDAVTLEWKDLDGDGSGVPVVTNGSINKNTTYNGAITLLNETESPAEIVNEEIEEEALDHQFFYTVNNNLVSVSYNDKDTDGNPIGLASKLVSSDATGNVALTITLRHEPNKSADKVSEGDITNAGGETDIEVTFDINVK